MTIATYRTQEDKQRLIERAIALKPKVLGVVATDRGWVIAQPKGTVELLVSFPGLDELLAEDKPEVIVEPVVEDVPVVIVEPIVEENPEAVIVAPVEDEEDEPVLVAPAKRGPKPKAK